MASTFWPSPGLPSVWETLRCKWTTAGWTHGAGLPATPIPARPPIRQGEKRASRGGSGSWPVKTWSLRWLSALGHSAELLYFQAAKNCACASQAALGHLGLPKMAQVRAAHPVNYCGTWAALPHLSVHLPDWVPSASLGLGAEEGWHWRAWYSSTYNMCPRMRQALCDNQPESCNYLLPLTVVL